RAQHRNRVAEPSEAEVRLRHGGVKPPFVVEPCERRLAGERRQRARQMRANRARFLHLLAGAERGDAGVLRFARVLTRQQIEDVRGVDAGVSLIGLYAERVDRRVRAELVAGEIRAERVLQIAVLPLDLPSALVDRAAQAARLLALCDWQSAGGLW